MKNFLIILSVLILASCNKKDDSGDIITNEFEQIKIILPQQQWEITNLYTNGSDNTADFQNFVFTFKEDGSVEGQTDLFTEVGTWMYKTTSENGEQLSLQFNGTPAFDKISNTWDITSISNSKIELSDVGSNNDNTKLLAFSKI